MKIELHKKKVLNHLFLLVFALSGVAALIYQIVWVRQFTKILGTSSYAVTIVLATFMAGLGLGSWYMGEKADSYDEKKLAAAYFFIEIGIGIYSLFLPMLLNLTETAYVAFYQHYGSNLLVFNGLKLFLAALILIIPTVLIGSTLPVMSRYIIRKGNLISFTVSKLYAMNTIGAIAGTIGAGYIFLPHLGIKLTTFVAIGINFLVAGVFGLINNATRSTGSTFHSETITIEKTDEILTPLEKIILLSFCLSGMSAMLYEIAWTRTLCMVLGTTTFAFTTMLATFLTGIALGSSLFGSINRMVSGVKFFIGLQFLIAFSVLFSIPLFGKLPFLFLSLHGKWIHTWFDMQIIRYILSALVMIVPTFAMGALLPAVSSIVIQNTSHLGRRLGKAYGLNTIGNVIGAVLAGLVLVPYIGMQKTIMTGAMLNVMAGCAVLSSLSGYSIKNRSIAVCFVCMSLFFIIFTINPWSPRVLNSGVYLYAPRYNTMVARYQTASEGDDTIPELSSASILEMAMKQYKLLYYNTGIASTVGVMERNDGVRFLTIDGKTDASTGEKSDMKTQVIIGHLPMLFSENPDEVLVVGLGSGVTAGAVLAHDVRVVDCVEISPSVIKACHFFSDANNDILNNKRLEIIQRDARNLLLTTERYYDVIISQPSNPWISGESNLFSLEWYQLVKKRMKKDGLFLQWVPSYLISEPDLKIIIHTIRTVFPHLTVWTTGSLGDLIFISKKESPLLLDYEKFLIRTEKKEVRQDIVRVGLSPELIPFDLFVMNEEEVGVYLYSNLTSPLRKNTDDLLITEFSTPKQLVQRKKISRFLKPKELHGELISLMEIMANISAETVTDQLKRKVDRKESI